MLIEIDQQDDICILRVEGRFASGGDLEYLRDKMNELKQLHCGKVLIDVRQMPYIGSTGIGFIVGIFSSLATSSGRFVLVGLQPRVREVFEITRLSTVIPMTDDLTSGLALLRAEGHSAG